MLGTSIISTSLFVQASRSTQRTMFAPAKLTVVTVYNKLKDIASMTGHSVRTLYLRVWYILWCGMVQCGVVWCGQWCGMVQYGMIWYGVIQYGMVYCVVQYGMIWCGVVWCDIVWYGILCYVIVHGMRWYGIV